MSKQYIESKYNELNRILQDCLRTVQTIEGHNKEIRTLQSGITDSLRMYLSKVSDEAQKSQSEVAWDRLVIAFFGETNAGKSTIIETFRILFDSKRKAHNDGLIVGDGRQDFTKDYHEYNLSIDGLPFTLIDVPGIEGNETEFKDIIKGALRKAHCVFYVQGHNKKPDAATAEKIKYYLGDWVNVYSIQNIRNDASYYDEEEERETLLTPNVLKNERLITETFQSILGDVYKGNIPLQALLAMCAKADFSPNRADLIKTQKKLLRYFGDTTTLLRFSQFQTIINLVKDKSVHFTDEIEAANKQKLISLSKSVISKSDGILESGDEAKNGLHNRLITFRRDVKTIIGSTKIQLSSKISNEVSIQFSSLKQDLYAIIDGDSENKKERMSDKIYSFKYSLPNRINRIVSEGVEGMKSKIQAKRKSLAGINGSYNIDIPVNVNLDIDIDDAVGELDVNLDDIGDFALGTAGLAGVGAGIGSVIPGVGTLVGAAIGAGVGFLMTSIKKGAGDHGTGAAKNELSKEMDESKKTVQGQVTSFVDKLSGQLDAVQKEIMRCIDNELESLSDIDASIDEIKQRLYNYIQRLESNN